MFTKKGMVIFMNKHESDILELLLKDSRLTQRQFSERCQKFLKIIKKRQPNRLSLLLSANLFLALKKVKH